MRTNGRRLFWILAMFALLFSNSGCSQINQLPLADELEHSWSGLYKEKGKKVEGYQLVEGPMEEYQGRARVVGQDSLYFWQEIESEQFGSRGIRNMEIVPGPVYKIEDIQVLEVKEFEAGVAAVFIVIPVAILVGYGISNINPTGQ